MVQTPGRAYTEASVLTASPERLVVMLYEGAIRFLAQSAAAMRLGARERARERMRRAEAIIDELNVVLDMERGGEIALRLRSLYFFCKRQLMQANVRNDPDAVERVGKILAELRAGFAAIADRGTEQPPQ